MLVADLNCLDGVTFLPGLLVEGPIVLNPRVRGVGQRQARKYLIVEEIVKQCYFILLYLILFEQQFLHTFILLFGAFPEVSVEQTVPVLPLTLNAVLLIVLEVALGEINVLVFVVVVLTPITLDFKH